MSRPERARLADLPGFTIGQGAPRFLEVRILRRSHAGANDADDADWVEARVLASAGGFRADYEAALCSSDFPRYRNDLLRLTQNLTHAVRLETLEQWIAVTLAHSDRQGHITASCEITDHPGMGAVLRFEIDLVQSDVDAIVRGLDSVISAYPAPHRR